MPASSDLPFVCPRCKGGLDAAPGRYRCAACGQDYPVSFGIPDFRLRGDRYLTLEEERAKAARLDAFAGSATFEALLGFYYRITDDVPPALAARYQAQVRAGAEKGRAIVDELGLGPADTLMDVGCGAGGLLVAASGRCGRLIGVDIALRWLVICRKQLAERGVAASLVCADAEALPFPHGVASHVVGADLIEHVADVDRTIASLGTALAEGGTLWLSAANRWFAGPHATTGIWAIGLLPRRGQRWLLLRWKGIDLLRHVNAIGPAGLVGRLRSHGLAAIRLRPKPVPPDGAATPFERRLIAIYRAALGLGAGRWLLAHAGPGFVVTCRRGGRA